MIYSSGFYRLWAFGLLAVTATSCSLSIHSATNVTTTDTTSTSGGGGGGTTTTSYRVDRVTGAMWDQASYKDGIGTAAEFTGPWAIASDGTNLYITDDSNHTIRKMVIATGEVTTLAGQAGVYGYHDGVGTDAQFTNPASIVSDGTYLYVADQGSCIRRIDPSTRAVTTFAGSCGNYGYNDGTGTSANFSNMYELAYSAGTLYATDSGNSLIRKIDIASRAVTTFAGIVWNAGYQDGAAGSAMFNWPGGITTDGTYLYVADQNNYVVRKVLISTGAVSTYLGTQGTQGSVDGTGASALFGIPRSIYYDGTSLFVGDNNNNTIRKVNTSNAQVTTVAGHLRLGNQDGTGLSAWFNGPGGFVRVGTDLYFADRSNNQIRKMDTTTLAVTTVAGNTRLIRNGYVDSATAANVRMNYAYSMVNDGTYIYFAEIINNCIRKTSIATGATTTLTGDCGNSGSSDGTGAAAKFNQPTAIALDGTNLYVADTNNHTIRKIVIATGAVTTLAGSAGLSGTTDATGSSARFNHPSGLASDGTYLYVSDTSNHTIRKILISSGAVTTYAGTAGAQALTNGTGSAARFNNPNSLVRNGTLLYVADTGNGAIRKIDLSNANVTSFTTGLNQPYGLATDGSNLYVAGAGGAQKIDLTTVATSTLLSSEQYGVTYAGGNVYVGSYLTNNITVVPAGGGTTSVLAGPPNFSSGPVDGDKDHARFNSAGFMATDGTYIFVQDGHAIRKVDSSGNVSAFVGDVYQHGYTDASGTSARFYYPSAMVAAGGHLYVDDESNCVIRDIVIATGAVSTLAGNPGSCNGGDGTGSGAEFNDPYGLTTDGTFLYVGDYYQIRKVEIATGVVTTLAGTIGNNGSADGTGAAAEFDYPCGMATDGTYVYISDNYAIRRLKISTGEVVTIAGQIAVRNAVFNGTGTAAGLQTYGQMYLENGLLYLPDYQANQVRTLDVNSMVVSTFAGSFGRPDDIDGDAVTTAAFLQPQSIVGVPGVGLFVNTRFNIRWIH